MGLFDTLFRKKAAQTHPYDGKGFYMDVTRASFNGSEVLVDGIVCGANIAVGVTLQCRRTDDSLFQTTIDRISKDGNGCNTAKIGDAVRLLLPGVATQGITEGCRIGEGNHRVPQSIPDTVEVQTKPLAASPKGGQIRHIVCLCYDRPYTQQEKMTMQQYIISQETAAGGIITPTSRITFDSFYDNANLNKPNAINDKLTQIYMNVYPPPTVRENVDKTKSRGELSQDGEKNHIDVKFFVLYG